MIRDRAKKHTEGDYANKLKMAPTNLSWLFVYPKENVRLDLDETNSKEYCRILDLTLRSLDESILSVQKLEAVENAFVIKWEHSDLIIQDGQSVQSNLLSSGTKMGLRLANTMFAIKQQRNSFYYCDEQFPYVHSNSTKKQPKPL